MIAVIFEVEPKEGFTQSYLDHAAMLKPILEKWMALFPSSALKAWPNRANICPCHFGAMKKRSKDGATLPNIDTRRAWAAR